MRSVVAAADAKVPVKGRKKAAGVRYGRPEVEKLREVFDQTDKDASGEVSCLELVTVFGNISQSQSVVKGMVKEAFLQMDANKDGKISFAEMLHMLYPQATPHEMATMIGWGTPKEAAEVNQEPGKPVLSKEQETELRAMFQLFDKNRNGQLERQELAAAAAACGYDSDELEELFDNADLDKNGSLSVTEFVQLMA